MNRFDALILVSFGGPEKPDDVLPFLENVTRGRGIPKERLLEVAEHYRHLGGRSPINDHCRALIAALEPALREAGIALPVYWGNRNWHPMLGDTVERMRADGVRRALAFTTSSFSSYSSCRQYLENLEAAVAGADEPRIEKLRQHWNHPLFLEAVTDRVRTSLASLSTERLPATRLVFSAHSIPNAMAATCRYEAQLAEASRLVAERLEPEFGVLPRSLCYQSRSGPHAVPWLGPDVLDLLRTLPGEGVQDVVLVPLGFTSDHVEVIWDLDHDAANLARELGIGFHRVATVGVHPRFVEMIVDLVRERLEERSERPALGSMPAEPDVCAPGCCAYTPRRPAA